MKGLPAGAAVVSVSVALLSAPCPSLSPGNDNNLHLQACPSRSTLSYYVIHSVAHPLGSQKKDTGERPVFQMGGRTVCFALVSVAAVWRMLPKNRVHGGALPPSCDGVSGEPPGSRMGWCQTRRAGALLRL